jgi:ArsR family transcriptional regulator
MDIEQLTKISRALADPTRMRIYEAIAVRRGAFCGDLAEEVGIAPGTVSHHLRVLTEAQLVVSRRHGQSIFQRTIPETMKRYTKALARLSRRR